MNADNYMFLLERAHDLLENCKCTAKWFDETANHIHKELCNIETKDALLGVFFASMYM
ncbi:hypothetical protein JDS91_13455 [Bacillus cereus]|uniref:hypothetical protein n=1 Tax=Bacillus cereus TaxID=1396 RepID=UPI0018F5A70F|nr:hypothetical protein [Bacillus cereus]